VSAGTLTSEHLTAAGVAADTPVAGTDEGREFTRAILGNAPTLDVAAAEQDVIEAGEALVRRHPQVGAVLLECTNMAPYASALRDHLGIPVFDIVSFITWFHAGLKPRAFGHPARAPRPWRD
jgi:Asp/Glu/hydantoin racemase